MIFPSASRIEVCIDEAGRGCLMGDVCAAAVIMPHEYDKNDKMINMIRDSKKLPSKKRNELAEYIKTTAVAYGIGIATPEEIDKINILKATHLAMHRALDQINIKFDTIMVDGPIFKPYMRSFDKEDADWIPFECVIDGDNKYVAIAAASILAKTHRDNIVDKLVINNPEWKDMYGFHTNKGYGTIKHLEGLRRYGVLDCHRKTFKPVALRLNQN